MGIIVNIKFFPQKLWIRANWGGGCFMWICREGKAKLMQYSVSHHYSSNLKLSFSKQNQKAWNHFGLNPWPVLLRLITASRHFVIAMWPAPCRAEHPRHISLNAKFPSLSLFCILHKHYWNNVILFILI